MSGSSAACGRGAQLPIDDAFLRRYPHELRAVSSSAWRSRWRSCAGPTVIVMDEPTTGLDVNTQARLLEVIRTLAPSGRRRSSTSATTSAVVRNLADRVAGHVRRPHRRGGRRRRAFRRTARIPYTRRLLEAIPRIHTGRASRAGSPAPRSSRGTGPRAARSRRAATIAIDAVRRRDAPVDSRATGATRPLLALARRCGRATSGPSVTLASARRAVAADRGGRRGAADACETRAGYAAGGCRPARPRAWRARRVGRVASTSPRDVPRDRRRERQREDDAGALPRRPARAARRRDAARRRRAGAAARASAAARSARRIQIVLPGPGQLAQPEHDASGAIDRAAAAAVLRAAAGASEARTRRRAARARAAAGRRSRRGCRASSAAARSSAWRSPARSPPSPRC